jgi:hypothetical protein
MRRTLIVLMLVLAPAAQAEWVKVAQTDDTVYYVDPATLRREGSLRQIREVQDFAAPRPGGARSRHALFEFDCSAERWRVLAITDHAEPMAGGKVVGTWQGESAWSHVAPTTGSNIPASTTNRAILRHVCSL